MFREDMNFIFTIVHALEILPQIFKILSMDDKNFLRRVEYWI